MDQIVEQIETGKSAFDLYVNDSDLISTHVRYGKTVALSDFMAGEGKDVH